MHEDNLDLEEIPLVIQYNKRDLEGSVIPVLDRVTLDRDLISDFQESCACNYGQRPPGNGSV